MSQAPRSLTKDEAEKLLAALDWKTNAGAHFRKCLRNRCLALLMLDAGLRVGEVVQLQMSDLYFDGTPSHSVIVHCERSKSKRDREIPMSSRLRSSLTTYKDEHHWLDYEDDTALVFDTCHPSKIMSTRQVERIITSAGMKAIGKPVNPHMLRHTCATRLMKVTNIRVVQELLGHQNISSTQIYTHPDAEDRKNAVDKMEENETGN